MRTGNNPSWLQDENVLVGIALGADYCAEHEMGIGPLSFSLGVDGARHRYDPAPAKYTKPPGLPRRMITQSDGVRFYESGPEAILLGYDDDWWIKKFEEAVSRYGLAKMIKEKLPSELRSDRELSTAWDQRSFGIYARGEHAPKLKELAQAFKAKNVALWLGGSSSPFQNASLILVIADRVRPENVKTLEDADIDADKLEAAHQATGITERLAAAGRRYYACSPRWKRPDKMSAHPVMYWLNPMEQDQNNFGWFSVEELDQWIKGEGPVPKKMQTSK